MFQEQPQIFPEYSELNSLNAEGYCIYTKEILKNTKEKSDNRIPKLPKVKR